MMPKLEITSPLRRQLPFNDQKVDLESGATVNKISTDHALASNSNDVLVTEKAIKTYVDNQIASVAIVYQ